MIRIIAALLLSMLLIVSPIIVALPLLMLIIFRDGKILWLRRKENNYKSKHIVIFHLIILASLTISNLYIISKKYLDPCQYKNVELNAVIHKINNDINASRLSLVCVDDCGKKKADISWNKKISICDAVKLIARVYDLDLDTRLAPLGYSLGGFRAKIFGFKNKQKQKEL